jgi:signal transduction histidine kinase
MFTSYTASQGLPSGSNGPVYVDSSGRTWFAPLLGGLYWLKDGHVERITVDGLDKDVVYSISGGDGEVWVGRQRGGLTALTETKGRFTARTFTQADGLVQNSIYSVHRSRDGSVWAGSVSGGVSRLQDHKFTNYSMTNEQASNNINSIEEGADGKMWFATPSGLVSFADGHWTNHTTTEGLLSSDVKTIFEDSKQVLWIATSSGLAYFSDGHIRVPPNLPEPLREEIFGIAEDGSNSLWFATPDHVLKVNRDRLEEGSLDDLGVRSYGIADGLQGGEEVSRDRAMVADAHGRIWVSLNLGVAVADPKRVLKNSVPVTVRIDSMLADETQINLQGTPKIAAGSRSITFNYESGSLSGSDHVRFRYALDGSNQGWNNIVAARQVNYANLGPGSYCFRVVAFDLDGLWIGREADLRFVIEPAFWQTWWFRALCVSASILFLLTFYRLRMYQITRQLSLRFQERLAERTRIAQELHDTLLQGVHSASLQLDLVEDQLPDNSPTRPRLKRVLEILGQVSAEGRKTLHGLRTTDGEKLSLERAFSQMKQDAASDEQIDFRVVVQGEPIKLRPLIRDEVYSIGREALVNAFTHAHAKSIEVEVEYANRDFRMLVRDDGCGIDPQVLNHGREGHWGLSGIRERSEGIGAMVHLRSRIGAGTEIELTIPGAVAFEKERHGSLSIWRRLVKRWKQKQPPDDK